MKTKNTKDDLIISHLEYIRTRVDEINGRVRENERQISWIKGIGVMFVFGISSIMTWLGIDK
jgi:hypothetical protein|tara:strand:- start:275 stop:460 length:186 start_codon:yes stop_codon:yes gene_type:complete